MFAFIATLTLTVAAARRLRPVWAPLLLVVALTDRCSSTPRARSARCSARRWCSPAWWPVSIGALTGTDRRAGPCRRARQGDPAGVRGGPRPGGRPRRGRRLAAPVAGRRPARGGLVDGDRRQRGVQPVPVRHLAKPHLSAIGVPPRSGADGPQRVEPPRRTGRRPRLVLDLAVPSGARPGGGVRGAPPPPVATHARAARGAGHLRRPGGGAGVMVVAVRVGGLGTAVDRPGAPRARGGRRVRRRRRASSAAFGHCCGERGCSPASS